MGTSYRETLSLQEELGTSGAVITLGNLAQALVEAGEVDEAWLLSPGATDPTVLDHLPDSFS